MTLFPSRFSWFLPALVVLFNLCQVGQAFPPASCYTIYGTVRDEVGQVLRQEDASVVLIKGAEVVLKAPVTVDLQFGQNYELRIPINMLRTATTLYRDGAVISRSGYQIAVGFGGNRYYPVAVPSSLTAGGQRAGALRFQPGGGYRS